jgi:acetoin:2,6-dichlorophenolindophenol oxidoreductase subunit alpha
MIGVPHRRRRVRPPREQLLHQMVRIRRFEEAIGELWRRGLISGEMHLGIGEEAIVAGVLAHAQDGDALAVDHRSTPPLVAHGTDLEAMLLEMLGHEDGLCGGCGGHMHLFDRGRLAASTGIVGAPAPTACGFALAAQHQRPGSVAFAFFGEGAMNQGMLLEAFNLAAAWTLPVVFVCRDSGWAITTRSRAVTGGSLIERARAFGLHARRVDGSDVDAVWKAAGTSVAHARAGRGPSFVLARCRRPDGHFLGDPLVRVLDDPLKESRQLAPPMFAAALHGAGAPRRVRLRALLATGGGIARVGAARLFGYRDPLRRARRRLPAKLAGDCERRAEREVHDSVRAALGVIGAAA